MYATQFPAPQNASGRVVTIVLAAVHAGLVVLTLLSVLGVWATYDADFHDRCRIHGLNCDAGSRVGEAFWVAVAASVVLILLDLVLTIGLLRRRQRLAFLVPLVCCIAQFIVIGVVFALGAGTA